MFQRMTLYQLEVFSEFKGYVNNPSISASILVKDTANKQMKTYPKNDYKIPSLLRNTA